MSDSAAHSHSHSDTSIGTYVAIYIWLMILLVATVVVAHWIDLGAWNIVIALLIATVKGALVVLFFMHVLQGGKLVWIFAASAFLWLGILLVITLSDYMTRNQLPRGELVETRHGALVAPH